MLFGEAEHVLVIAPLNVARTVWSEECAKWDHLQHIRCSKVLGTSAERLAALQEPADIHIINRESVPWLVEHQIQLGHWPWDTVVIDELSSFKAANTARFKALRKARPQMKRIIGATGTPSPNSLIDLFPQIFLLDSGERLGKSITQYRARYFQPDKYNPRTGQVYKYKPLPGAEQQIYDKISDIVFSMESSDYIQLPEKLTREIVCDMPNAARKACLEMEKNLYTSMGDEELTAANSAVLANKLLQLSSGEIYNDDHTGTVVIHDGKIRALQEIVDTSTTPVLVFYAYKHELMRIRQAIPEAVQLKGAEQVEQWNKGNIQVLLAHPDSAGHGLNLQAGGHTIIWYTLPWSLEKYQQACARLWRRGQKESVIIHHLICKDTIDERVLQVLQHKDQTQEALMAAVKARKEEVEKYAG